jgi:hypothetical protein
MPFRRPVLWGITFFLTVCLLSVTYAAWTNLDRNDAAAGQFLTASLMQGVIDDLNDLNARVTSITTGNCPAGMTKVGDFCIDNTAVTDAAGEDQKMAMQRCVGQNKRLCSFGEYKQAWVSNASFICPSGVGRYVTSEIFAESTARQLVTFECGNCSSSTS